MDKKPVLSEWWANADGKAVPYGSIDGVRVLYAAGAMVPADVADSLNGETNKAMTAPPSDKAVRKAPKTK
jgi:hypothetical protein